MYKESFSRFRVQKFSRHRPTATRLKEDTIKGVTFHIPPGTRFALVGNNGAGCSFQLGFNLQFGDPTQ